MYDDYPMDEDLYGLHEHDFSYDNSQQPTQQTQLSTQQASQAPEDPVFNQHLWGYLLPCNPIVKRIDLWKNSPNVKVGRSSENDIVFPHRKISNKHCLISWDTKVQEDSLVTVKDLSSNGTFIDGIKVGRNRTAVLRDGQEIGIGSWAGQGESSEHDFRYIFRFTAVGPPKVGLHAFYDIAYELGKGTFATVVKAVNRSNGKSYAVKMINQTRLRNLNNDSKKELDMFVREISILRKLRHPNICLLEETFQDANSIYIVLEYIDGGDLLEYIIKKGGLAEKTARYFTYQMCDALKYIHSQGIAHRDLKPENVLLTSSDPPILKVADFGLAKAVDSVSKFMTTCGTPIYLAPEVILRNPGQSYDQAVDSWSLGVIVFCMLANATPFVEENKSDIRDRFRSRIIDWGILEGTGVSRIGFRFVQQLLIVDPRTRMTCTNAMNDPWLLAEEREYAYGPAPGVDVYNDPGPSLPGTSINFNASEIQSVEIAIPEDQPQSQESEGVDHRLIRHKMEVGERGTDGAIRDFGDIPIVELEEQSEEPAEDALEEQPRDQPKRKGYSAMDEDSDSSLTPVSGESEMEADDIPSTSEGHSLRGGRRGADTVSSRGKAPAKRKKSRK